MRDESVPSAVRASCRSPSGLGVAAQPHPRTDASRPSRRMPRMLTEVRGLPVHVLLVHLVVVLVPLAALFLVASAWSPEARRRLGILTPLLCLAALVLTPITTNAGKWLQDRVGDTPLVREHANLGHGLWPWTLGLFLLAAVVWVLHRRDEAVIGDNGRAALIGRGTSLQIAAGVLAVVIAA